MTSNNDARREAEIVVVGAGLIGRRHVEHVVREAALSAIVDPNPEAADIATAYGVPVYPGLSELFGHSRPDGVIIATPTPLHAEQAIQCIDHGVPVLIEKPVTDQTASAQALVAHAERAKVPVVVGHHRRHNPLIARAKETIESGRLGSIVMVNAMCWLYKPDDYFDLPWRREPGAGPVLTNLIHDVDLLRYLCGDIESVTAHCSNATRGFAIEDSAAILLKFASGALGTVTVSDTVVAPWSWELTAAENPTYPATGDTCYTIGGTRASLSLPDLNLWHSGAEPSWWLPMSRETIVPADNQDPLAIQVRHFADVCLGKCAPLVDGRAGLETLRVIDAVNESANTAMPVSLSAS